MSNSELPIIKAIRARGVKAPVPYPLRTSVGLIDSSPLVLIDVETSAGIVGHGYVFAYTPLVLSATTLLVESFGAAGAGRSLAPYDVDPALAGRLRLLGRPGLAMIACAGIDMALWDAVAKFQGVPLVRLLGGTPHPIPVYDSHGLDGPDLGLRRAMQAAEQGFRAVKTKLGYPTLEEDLAMIRTLRRALGDGVLVMTDFNQGLTVPEAERRIRALRDEGVAWIEEPTAQEDLAGHARLRGLGLPIQLGENWYGPGEMQRALAAGACDLAMPDAMKIGGVTGWMRAAALAEVAGVPMSSHLFPEISVHLLGVTPTVHWLERMDLAAPILAQPVVCRDGLAQCPEVPGTGIEWDEAAVARYAA